MSRRLTTKVHIIKAMVFPVVMYGCENWTEKKADCRRIDALELWSWRRLLRVPWPERRSNQSILKEINPKYSLEGLMLKLKFQYFGHLMSRANSLEKTLMLGKIEGRRRSGWQKMRWLDGIIDPMDVSLANSGRQWRTGKPGMLQSMGSQGVWRDWVTEQQEIDRGTKQEEASWENEWLGQGLRGMEGHGMCLNTVGYLGRCAMLGSSLLKLREITQCFYLWSDMVRSEF